MSNQRKKVGAGWLKTSQDGKKKYVSVVINGGLSPDIHLVMFPNSYKEEDNQPDYIIYLSMPKDAAAAEQKAGKPEASAEFPESGQAADDGIPF